MKTKKSIFLIVAVFYIVYSVFPLFSDVLHIPVWLPSIATVTMLVFLYPKAFANSVFYWFLAYALVLIVYVQIGKPLTIGIGTVTDKYKVLIEFAYLLPAIGIFCTIYYLKDVELAGRLIKLSLVFMFVSFILTVPLMIQYGSLREALKEQDEVFIIPGLPGYSLMHSYTLFLPVFCFLAKIKKGEERLLSILGLVVLCFVIYCTFVTTSLFIALAILLFTIFYSSRYAPLSIIIVFSAIIVVFLLSQSGVLIPFIDWIIPAFEDTAVEPKLLALKSSMLQGELTGGSITVRLNYHQISWNSFIQNPILGSSIVGGHSSIMDRFGGMGILAGFPFIMIIVSFVRQALSLYRTKDAKAFFAVGILAGLVYLYEKGNWGFENWLMYMVLLPTGIFVFEQGHGLLKSYKR